MDQPEVDPGEYEFLSRLCAGLAVSCTMRKKLRQDRQLSPLQMHCMLPAEEVLTPGETSGVEARVNESSNNFVG